MFTLGDKLRVLNADAEVAVRAGDVSARTSTATYAVGESIPLSGDITSADSISIEGFGKFAIADITDMKVHRAVTPVAESKDYTCVVPAGLAIGDAIEVLVTLKTSRYHSINCYCCY
jgi:hypothetical protein